LTTKLPVPVADLSADTRPEDLPVVLRYRRLRPTPLLQVRPKPSWYLAAKAWVDTVLALMIALPAIPVVLLAALVVRLTSRGPAFYSQTRVGLGGKPFTIWKIRSMVVDSERNGAQWCTKGDPRVTAFGWFLRKSHIDELPQLLNVLRGEMALIGPRPERPEFIPQLEAVLPAYRQRLGVKPGVSGLAQVQLPPDTDLDSVRRKLAHDLYYVRHLSFWFDVRLFVATAFYAATVPFRFTGWLLRLPLSDEIEQAMSDVVSTEPIHKPIKLSA
jgi:lipopolysaccharide/colanic/teichoic acid biosynthesis glycosyltransferase